MKMNRDRPFWFAVVASVELLFITFYFSSPGVGDLMATVETDSSKPYASVCVAVRDENEANEVAFTPELRPGPGKSIVAHAIANAPCSSVVPR
jgi:hypothetical protein